MRRYNRSQTDQDEVLDNCCYVISILIVFRSKDYIIIIIFFLDISSVEHGIVKKEKKT